MLGNSSNLSLEERIDQIRKCWRMTGNTASYLMLNCGYFWINIAWLGLLALKYHNARTVVHTTYACIRSLWSGKVQPHIYIERKIAMQVRIQLEGLENVQRVQDMQPYVCINYRHWSLHTAHRHKHTLNAKCTTYFALWINGPALWATVPLLSSVPSWSTS